MLKSSYTSSKIEAGCDEAGRGCLAGPVFAASVILPLNFKHELLNDSKKLKKSDRYFLREIILKNAIEWAVASADHLMIDEINILNASFLAMHRSIDKLTQKPELLLIDGNRFKPYKNIDHICIIKGDGKYASIAAASILAKTYRDDFMIKIAKDYPEYRWEKNKAYPTKEHRDAILKNGISPYHRKSFRLLKPLTLDFN